MPLDGRFFDEFKVALCFSKREIGSYTRHSSSIFIKYASIKPRFFPIALIQLLICTHKDIEIDWKNYMAMYSFLDLIL